MSKSSNNQESKIKYFNIRLDDNGIDDLYSFVENIRLKYDDIKYYAIKHDRDLDSNGELKHLHYHLVIKLQKGVRLSTMRNVVDELWHCPNNNVDSVRSFNASIQYLIHKNDEDKFQYDESDVMTNDTLKHLHYFSLIY